MNKSDRLVVLKARHQARVAVENAFAFGKNYSEVLALAEQVHLGDLARELFEFTNEKLNLARSKAMDNDGFSFNYSRNHPTLAGQTARDGRQHDVLSKKMQRTTVRQLAASAVVSGFNTIETLEDKPDRAGQDFDAGEVKSQLDKENIAEEN